MLKGEEDIQKLKKENLKLMKSKLQIEVEVANLQKKKLLMEIAVLKKQDPTLAEDIIFQDSSTALTFEDLLRN